MQRSSDDSHLLAEDSFAVAEIIRDLDAERGGSAPDERVAHMVCLSEVIVVTIIGNLSERVRRSPAKRIAFYETISAARGGDH